MDSSIRRSLAIRVGPVEGWTVPSDLRRVPIQGADCRARRFRGSSFLSMCGDAPVAVDWDGERVAVFPSPIPPTGVAIDGRELNETVHHLRPGDLVQIDGLGVLVADEGREDVLSETRWENGRLSRTRDPRFPLSGAVAWLIDRGASRGFVERRNDDVRLALDLALSDRVSRALGEFATEWTGAPIHSIAVTVIDAPSGRVRALAGWAGPGWSPGGAACPDPALTAGTAWGPALHLNFSPHFPGSAVKPFMASAALAAYPELEKLEVRHPGGAIAPAIAGIPVRDGGWPGLDTATESGCVSRLARGGWIDFDVFLTCSSNFFAATLDFLAAAPPGEDPRLPTVTGPRRRDIRVGKELLGGSPLLSGQGSCDGPEACVIANPRQLARSPISVELARLFDVSTVASRSGAGLYDRDFWDPLLRRRMLDRSIVARNRVSPCVSRPYFDLVRDAGDYARFAVGSQENRWTNLHMAQGMARILTGRNVRASLVESIEGDAIEGNPPPLDGAGWREPVAVGLLHVVDRGTAASLQPFVVSMQEDLGQFQGELGEEELERMFDAAGKTGTHADPPARALVLGAGLWEAAPETGPVLACGGVFALRVQFQGPELEDIPDLHLQLARELLLPLLAQRYRFSDPTAARQCYGLTED